MSRKRLVVTGLHGQVVTSLMERAEQRAAFEVFPLGRPQLDLAAPESIAAAIEAARPDAIVSAAAYTAVDQAETEEELAMRTNGVSAGEIARAADRLGVPIIHLSTDYVFDGSKAIPYVEEDPTAPVSAYGRSKLTGELAVRDATDNHAILRIAWIYSPFGKNFLKTMLALAQTRDALSVVDDQVGNPTSALDIADGILTVGENLVSNEAASLRGIFHMASAGEASWADFAEEIFDRSRTKGGPSARVNRISSNEYPTLAKRPVNSRLGCRKLKDAHGIMLPSWQSSTAVVVDRVVGAL